MKNIFTSISLCALFLLFGFSQTVRAATTWVVTKTADTNDGICDSDCSLREAIAVSQNGDTINFSSLFNTPQTIDITTLGQLTINTSIQINGPTNKVLITKNSSVIGGIFSIDPGGTAYIGLFNLKISNGNVGSGGIGGGILIYSGDVSIVNSEIYNNKANTGGGIYTVPGFNTSPILHLIDSSVTNNSAFTAGGIFVLSTSIRGSTISNNTALNRGGGIFSQSYLSVLNSTVSDNTAYNSNCNPPTYCSGGGIEQTVSSSVSSSSLAPLIIRNSTITSNSSQDGGGIWSNSAGVKQITNSIIAGNTTTYAYPDVYGSNYSSVSSLIGKIDFATGFTNGVDGNIVGTTAAPVNPMLGPLQDNGGPTFTRELLAGSPAINAGSNANATDPENGNVPLTVDQRGLPRISTGNLSSSIIDIGAFERQYVSIYEADVQLRPNGDGFVDSDDIQQIRLFSVGGGLPYQNNEFQRADCSPRSIAGDGFVDGDDVQQARRFSVGTDSLQLIGGPSSPIAPPALANPADDSAIPNLFVPTIGKSIIRKPDSTGAAPAAFRIDNQNTNAGQTLTVPIRVDTVGNEAGYTFSIAFDSIKLTNPQVAIGNGGGDVIFNANNPGQIGFSVTSFSGGTIAAANNVALVNVNFTVAAGAPSGTTPITFTDTPARRKASGVDPNNPITQPTYTGGTITIGGATAAGGAISGRVTTQSGRGITNVTVTLTDAQGNSRTAKTTSFGFYHFDDVPTGQTYILRAQAKRHQFTNPTQVLSVNGDLSEVNFMASQ